jgi:aspartate aminotransferase
MSASKLEKSVVSARSQISRQGSLVRKMFEQGRALKARVGSDKVFDFALGNPLVEPSEAFIAGLQGLLTTERTPGMHRYMSNAGFEDVRAAVANSINARQGLSSPLGQEHILMSCGAAGAINVFLRSVLDPGQEVITFSPYFVEYGFYAANHDGILKAIETDEYFQPKLDLLRGAINEKTRVVLINTPNNPTGVIYPKELLEGIARIIKEKEAEYGQIIYLLSDEPYAGLVYDGTAVPPTLDIFDHSVIATSHSKDLGIPGERIGYLALNPKIPAVHQLFAAAYFYTRTLGFVNAPALMQKAVKNFQGTVIGLEEYQARRDLLYTALVQMGYKVVKPQGTFYMFPGAPIGDSLAFANWALENYKLLVVPGIGFGREGYFRISFAETPLPVIQRALPAFRRIAEHFGLGR